MHVTHCYISPQHKGQLHQFLHIKVCLQFTEESSFFVFFISHILLLSTPGFNVHVFIPHFHHTDICLLSTLHKNMTFARVYVQCLLLDASN